MRVLILGGNRLFGKDAARELARSGHDVTLLNRGNVDDGLGSEVRRIKGDRDASAQELNSLLGENTYDCVIDQICFDAKQARSAKEVFGKRTPLFIATSTISVYDTISHRDLKEDEFIPSPATFKDATAQENYGEAKRQMERVIFDQAPFRVIAPRFPIICATDDYSRRLHFHVEHVKSGKAIAIPNLEAHMTYISSLEAGRVLMFLAQSKFEGPVNVGSLDDVSIGSLLRQIESVVGKKAILNQTGDESPYAPEKDFSPSVELLTSLGCKLPKLADWMPEMIREITKQH